MDVKINLTNYQLSTILLKLVNIKCQNDISEVKIIYYRKNCGHRTMSGAIATSRLFAMM